MIVRILEIVGIINSFFLKLSFFYLFFLAGYAFLRLCDLIPWYPGEPRGAGLEVHFKKTMVPVSYLLVITSLAGLFHFSLLFKGLSLFSIFITSVFILINVVLIFFYGRDRDPLPINYFSRNKYLLNPETSDSRDKFSVPTA